VTPLLPPFAHAADGRRRVDFTQGSEREIAIMFVDIRGFTGLSEGRLSYDVVFMLNRYFAAMGLAVEAAGGRLDKFIGDGVMALSGSSVAPKPAAGRRSPPGRCPCGSPSSTLRCGPSSIGRCVSVSAFIAGLPSSERWAMATPPRLLRSATPSIPRAASKA
jgi:class 3 adenylate cyclase